MLCVPHCAYSLPLKRALGCTYMYNQFCAALATNFSPSVPDVSPGQEVGGVERVPGECLGREEQTA